MSYHIISYYINYIILLAITFIQGVYNYLPEPNLLSMVHIVAAIQQLQFIENYAVCNGNVISHVECLVHLH